MSNTEIKLLALAYNDLFKSTKSFNEVRESLENNMTGDSFSKEEVEKVKQTYQERFTALEKFEKEFDKLEKFFPSDVFKNLKDAIANEKVLLGRIIADASGYLDLNDDMYLSSLMEAFSNEKDSNIKLGKELSDFSSDLGFNLLKQALAEQITLEDLRLMKAAFENDSELYERINMTIEFLEKKELEKEREEVVEEAKAEDVQEEKEEKEETEEEKTEDKENKPAENTDNVVESEPHKPTLQEKIANINYKMGSNINAEVQELTVDGMIESLTAQIEALEAKDKLTVKETFKLRQLKEQELAFQTYKNGLDEQQVSRRESNRNKKLDNTLNKIDSRNNELQAAIEQSQNYSSRTMRFFSSRYQQRLREQLESLRTKQGELTDMQKYSAIARFDKESKKIIRRSRRKGTIEQLKAYRASLINEFSNIAQDVNRFISTKVSDMQELQETTVVIPDNIISLDEYRRSLEQAKVA